MKVYKSPGLVSYKCQDILEIIGPVQNQYATMDVGGGWKEGDGVVDLSKLQDEMFAEAGIETIDKGIG